MDSQMSQLGYERQSPPGAVTEMALASVAARPYAHNGLVSPTG